MSGTKPCPMCGNENWDGSICPNCGYGRTVSVKYVTKSGEVLYSEFSTKNSYTFEHWFTDRMQREGGFFPYEGGRINCDALARIEVVGR